jgi:drug/metabolite transporter (DMT)-like permease
MPGVDRPAAGPCEQRSATTKMRGLAWCLTFLVLDSVQAVYLGGLFQRMDSFLIGALVFGLSTAFCLVTAAATGSDLRRALARPFDLAGLNVASAGGWTLYLLAIQLIEPAVAFTLFSGIIPLVALTAGRIGLAEEPGRRNPVETAGLAILTLGLIGLAATTLAGGSGFVRGGVGVALGGIALALVAGTFITAMLIYGRRLAGAGVGPLAQSGLRFPLYLALAAAGYSLGLDHKGPVAPADLATAVAIGLVVLAFPIYAVQKAVSLTSTLTIGAFAALGPLLVFLLQMPEGRVDYAPATLAGLLVYFAGALIAAFGSVRAAARV